MERPDRHQDRGLIVFGHLLLVLVILRLLVA